MPDQPSDIREYIYLDWPRVSSLAAQLNADSADSADAAARERIFAAVEQQLSARRIDGAFDFARWTPENFKDGQLVAATGAIRLLDYTFLAQALGGLPAVLRKMSKLEMDALRNSEEGRRMSKTAIQQRSQENLLAIQKVEEFKIDELGAVVRNLYGDVVRIKIRPSPEQPSAVLIGSGYVGNFFDTPAVLSQKYGIEINAGWTVFAQLNVAGAKEQLAPIPVGNRMEDSFEQLAMLMNNAFRVASAPAWPGLSFTPLAIYRKIVSSQGRT
ncbi:MAG: hypothetical protein H0U59_06435 [Gemmatimonadaceae bacterium]|nr:hypothetical protein [Gemmatimonadaceae bacterium]